MGEKWPATPKNNNQSKRTLQPINFPEISKTGTMKSKNNATKAKLEQKWTKKKKIKNAKKKKPQIELNSRHIQQANGEENGKDSQLA